MEYIFLIAAIAAAIHACSFARWLWNNDNKSGTIIVSFLIVISLGVPVYRMMTLP
jgi:hypothetical protein